MAERTAKSRPSRAKIKAEYDAAKFTRRTSTWYAPSTGPNREIGRDVRTLRDRHRDLNRNNPWAQRAITAIVNNTVGTGIHAQWQDEARQERWRHWFESTECDADGRHDGYGLQALAVRAMVESGACLIRRRPRRPSDGLTVPLQIQLMEPDLIDMTKTEQLPGGGFITQGMEFNAWGQWVAIWLHPVHPGDNIHGDAVESTRHSSRDFKCLYRTDRPGQIHGVPWGAGAITRLKMLDDYQDAQLERARISACFAGFIRDIDAMGSDVNVSSLPDKLEPGILEFLPPGKTIEFASPPQPENDKEFRLGVLQAVGAAYGVPYETLTGDLSEVNFSSARIGWNEFARSIETWRWHLLAPQMLDPVAQWFLEAESAINIAPPEPLPLWTAPARTMVDPARETRPLIDAMRAGLMSLPEAIRKMGYDPIVLIHEHAAFLELMDSLGVAFDSDGRHGRHGLRTQSEERINEAD